MWRLNLTLLLVLGFSLVVPVMAQDGEEDAGSASTEEPSTQAPEEAPAPPPPPPATEAPAPTAVSAPAATAVPGPGSVVFSDNFDDPSKPNFPVTTRDATERSQGYIDGQYEIINGTRSGGEGEGLPGTYSNSTIAIDAKVSGGPDTAGPYVSCRRANNDNEGYQLSVEPARQRFRLFRYQGGGSANVTLVMQNSTAIRGKDEVNRLELTCAASTITAAINGTQVTSVQDATYTTGRHRFGVNGGGAVGRFDNLVVTLR